MSDTSMAHLVTGWNRTGLDLRSDEMLAQILDRGGLDAWRELFALAKADAALRARILTIVRRVTLPFPGFWLAAMASLGEPVDWATRPPEDQGIA